MKAIPKGLSMVSLVLIGLVFLALAAGALSLVGRERAKARDAQRVADMARLQVGFLLLYNRTASYAGAAQGGCATVNAPVRTCNLAQDLASIASFKDPRGGDYLVSKVPDEKSYEISFTLERGTSGLVPGKHVLTPAGIQ